MAFGTVPLLALRAGVRAARGEYMSVRIRAGEVHEDVLWVKKPQFFIQPAHRRNEHTTGRRDIQTNRGLLPGGREVERLSAGGWRPSHNPLRNGAPGPRGLG